MGAMNKHPSCKASWSATTTATLAVSQSLACMMHANVCLEQALLSEFEGGISHDKLEDMVRYAKMSQSELDAVQQNLREAIRVGESNPSPYIAEFSSLIPHLLSASWEETIFPGRGDVIRATASEIRGDHLAPSKKFIDQIDELKSKTGAVIQSLEDLKDAGVHQTLRSALEENKVPLQADFASLMVSWFDFLEVYIADSLIATHVAFKAEGFPELKVS